MRNQIFITKFIFILFFQCNPLFALIINEKTTKGDELINQLSAKELEVSEKYIQGKLKDRNQSEEKVETLKVKVADILNSGTFVGTIGHKTQLIKIEDESIYYTTREIIAKAYRQRDFDGYLFLINEDGSTTYKVFFQDITRIDEILKLHEAPLTYSALEQKLDTSFNDNDFKLETNFNIELGFTSSDFKSDLVGENNLIENTVRYEMETYGKWNYPLNLGLISGVENNKSTLDNGTQLSETNIYIGPSIKFSNTNFFLTELDITLDFKTSIYNDFKANSTGFNLTKNALNLGLIKKTIKKYGHFNWGLNFQQSWIVANAQNTALDINNQLNKDFSLTLNIGIGRDWKW